MSESTSSSTTNSVGRSVLVSLLGHTRPMSLPGGDVSTADVKQSVGALFKDILQLRPVPDFFLQLKDANWGEFVDLMDHRIPDRAVLRAQVIEQVR